MFIVNVLDRNPAYFSSIVNQQFITEDFNEALDWAEEIALERGWPTHELRINLATDYGHVFGDYGILITESE